MKLEVQSGRAELRNQSLDTGTTLKSGTSCIYLNARSIINKMDSLRAVVADINQGIIGIIRSCADDKVTDSELTLAGYDLF